MRELLYVPIIHDEVDFGSVGSALAQEAAALSGESRWALHLETVRRFWESVATLLRSFDSRRLKVYQDGMVAGGETAKWIVEEAARMGSRNYQLVLELLHRGAEPRMTEDPALLLREHENIRRSVQQGSMGVERRNTTQYMLETGRLMSERDRFIAGTIDATLREGEVGVLFMGAGHDVASRLPADIAVTPVKDRDLVRAYFQELLHGQDDGGLAVLARHLASPAPISRPPLKNGPAPAAGR